MKQKQIWPLWIIGIGIILLFVCLVELKYGYTGQATLYSAIVTGKNIAFFGFFKLMIVFVLTGFLLKKAK